MASYRGCGCELPKRHRDFCSNACQRAAERRSNVERWLSTGQANVVGAGANHYVRRHPLEQQGGVCAVCGEPSEWHGAPLTLVLDHVDGDADNNCRANLRLVCPNCDSQLPTFKARNRGNGWAWRRQRYADGTSY